MTDAPSPAIVPLSGRRTWVFDLDHTLYPPQARLFAQIERRMTAYVARMLSVPEAEADRLRRHYWASYGATLTGLMDEHGLDPAPYLAEVHDIDLGALRADPDLRAAIAALPGRRIVYSNGAADYVARVLAALGLGGLFDAAYGLEDAGYRPKPAAAAFAAVFDRDGLTGPEAAMFEDDPRNLSVPHDLGMATVLVAPERTVHAHVLYHTDNLTRFLRDLPL